MPSTDRASYKKDKLLILILIANMPLGLSMIWGCCEKKGSLRSTGTPIKNEQVNDLLSYCFLLPSEMAIVKTETPTKSTERE